MEYQNVTHKLLHDPAHQIDVRPSSRGPDFPYAVVITLDDEGHTRYQGRLGAKVCITRHLDRDEAIKDIRIYDVYGPNNPRTLYRNGVWNPVRIMK